MAQLGGVGATGASVNLSGGGSGREFLMNVYPLSAGDLENLEIDCATIPALTKLQCRVRRLVGGNWTLVGESQSITTGVTPTAGTFDFVFDTPITVLDGDVASVVLGSSATQYLASVADAGTCKYYDTDTTGDLVDASALELVGLVLSAGAFGTAGASASITINNPTQDTKAKKRDGSNQATFTVDGVFDDGGGTATTAVEYRLDTGSWLTLDASPGVGTFSGNVTVTNQQTVEVRLNNQTSITDSIDKVTAGVVIIPWGQSNQAGRGLVNQSVTVGGGNPTPLMYRTGTISDLTDPTGTDGSEAGSVWPRIAQQYSDAGIPVIIANVAVGATLLSQWQPLGTNYNKIVTAATALGGISFTSSVIGEQDQFAGTAEATVETEMEAIVDALFASYGCTTYISDHPNGDGLSGDSTNVRNAYDSVIANNAHAKDGGDLATIDIDIATAGGNDGIHLKQTADLTTAGNLMYTAFNAAVKLAEITLTSSTGSPQAGLTGLKWAWFDQVTPDLFVAPTDQGGAETTDGSGVLTITLSNTTKNVGETGWLVVTNSDGTTTQSPAHKAFAGPVQVSE